LLAPGSELLNATDELIGLTEQLIKAGGELLTASLGLLDAGDVLAELAGNRAFAVGQLDRTASQRVQAGRNFFVGGG